MFYFYLWFRSAAKVSSNLSLVTIPLSSVFAVFYKLWTYTYSLTNSLRLLIKTTHCGFFRDLASESLSSPSSLSKETMSNALPFSCHLFSEKPLFSSFPDHLDWAVGNATAFWHSPQLHQNLKWISLPSPRPESVGQDTASEQSLCSILG